LSDCGTCGNACQGGGSGSVAQICFVGQCLLRCASGHADCDADNTNGCETTTNGNCNVCSASSMCSPGSSMAPTACPAECTGGCNAELCTILCAGTYDCGRTTIRCPPGMTCHVSCAGNASCQHANIVCPPDSPCTVECVNGSACSDTNVQCPVDAPCSMNCVGITACQRATVGCGYGACSASCASANDHPYVICGASCSCTSCDAC
jgi:hypothetical protein